MMTILHRERKVLAGGLGKAFPLEKVGPRQAMRHDMLRHEGTTCHFQKSPSAGTTDKHFLWLLRKEEKKTKTKSKQHPRGRADRKQGVSYRSNTALRQARGTQLPGWSTAAEQQGAAGRPHLPPSRCSRRNASAPPRRLIRGKTLLPVPTCRSWFSGQGLWARHGPPTAVFSSLSIRRPANPLASKRKDMKQKRRFKGDVPLPKIPGIREGGVRNRHFLRMMQAFDYLHR